MSDAIPTAVFLRERGLYGLFALVIAAVLSSCDRETSDVSETVPIQAGTEVFSDWPLFRGDPQMQGVSAENITPPLQMAWSFEPKVEEGKRRPPIEAGPVIANGKVFVGSQDGQFYCVDLANGALVWSFKAEGPITAPAAVLGERVFFGDTYGFIYALETGSGKELWRFETEGKIEGGVNTFVPESGPARVFVGSHDYFLYALNADTGEVLWKHETGNYVVATPSMIHLDGGPALAFGGCDGLLHVISADGKGENREIEIGAYIANTSAVRDGICYVAHNGGEVVAVEIASGETVWKTKTGIEYTASPAVDEKTVYVAGPDKRLVAYDRIDGSEKWAFLAPRALSSSPLVSGDIVWQGGMDGRLYAVNRPDGTEAWNFELGTQMKASPAASRGTLVVCGEDGVVYGFKK
jgi:eukaryotic-like serine/threonine-protein kinase